MGRRSQEYHQLTGSAEERQALDAAYQAAVAHVRAFDRDRYIALLFAPAEFQKPLFALYAFNAEIARIREQVSEPMPGEIRHQWWREALSCRCNETNDNPIAFALNDTIRRFNLPPEPLLALIEARGFDLYDDPMPTWVDLEGYCGETSSALIRLATIILADGKEPGSAELCGHAGVAYALTGLLRAFPIHSRRQQCFIPHETLIACGVSHDEIFEGKDSDALRAALAQMRQRAEAHLAVLRARVVELDCTIRSAFFPCCLVQAYLDQMAARDYQPFATRVDFSPLRKFWLIGRSAWRARS